MPLDILIVDDSAAVRKILNRALVQADLPIGKVVEASDGRDALEKLGTQKFGLILTDVNMPNMDGIELLGAIKACDALKSIPVVMVTTEGSQERVMQALKLGAAGYLRKPFTADQVKDKLLGIV